MTTEKHKRCYQLPIVVIKFGSSVLSCDADTLAVVHEIYAYLRKAYRVVVVVSAISNTTDHLLKRATELYAGPESQIETTGLISLLKTGEEAAAALVTIVLQRVGIKTKVLNDAVIVTSGDPLNADPIDCDHEILTQALAESDVVVIPGFVGRDRDQQKNIAWSWWV